jgi:hypothetical protein
MVLDYRNFITHNNSQTHSGDMKDTFFVDYIAMGNKIVS